MVSQAGRPYQLAQLAAHNANFDGPFLRAWYQRIGQFCPARYQVLCTLQRSLWWFDEHRLETPPKDFKLQTLCEYFEVPLSDDEAHEAIADVRATLGLYRALRQLEESYTMFVSELEQTRNDLSEYVAKLADIREARLRLEASLRAAQIRPAAL